MNISEYKQDPNEIEFENDENEPAEESPVADLAKIVSYNIANTVEVLKLKIDNEEINLKPEFQRDFVWDINRASLFIDSLLTGLPIPSIFLGKDKEDESYIVIDGQQRLKSAYYFITGSFISNEKSAIFTLKGLKDREWNGKTFAELDAKYKRRINNAVLNTTIIEDINFRPRVVHDLFHRLNTGGVPLTDQEIRNCVYTGIFNKQIIELNSYNNWRILIGKPFPERRLRDVELVLRFFALFHGLSVYKESMREFLSTFQDNNKNNHDFIASNNELFKATVDLILHEIGPNAFKLVSTINKSVCDSVMVSIAQIITSRKSHANLKQKHQQIIADETYRKYVTYSTSSEANVTGRIDLARNYFLGLK
ncbi:DUF262 domain-containing protein [Hymenobacter sp. M29]|uniref:DUF262 domain-containing protein n=1 Tax=Hymenobacter mellowenesis TaxID=3063995 RepID=A0ABT9A9N5_9BACT|nr:DUF262 domain-containing protein [Hymenobacter sp. M29]MDO7846548.1 DUF262 domain-containing protein [Hymenobacter sp. M29]